MDYRWHVDFDAGQETDLAKVVNLLDEVVFGPPERMRNPYLVGDARGQFKQKLKAAVDGKLIPVDEVKPVGFSLTSPLFEIRWVEIRVHERLPDGTSEFKSVHVRLYHAEPDAVQGLAVGLHAHEKALFDDDSDTVAAQDREIQIAAGLYGSLRYRHWRT